MKRIGLIVNPIAGMGGAAAMKGSDRIGSLAEARKLHMEPVAPVRAAELLKRLHTLCEVPFELYTAPGLMGEEEALEAGYTPVLVGRVETMEETSAADTKRIAQEMAEQKLDLLVFAGGDGTARDVSAAIGTSIQAFGLPSGVKMHSSVFAIHVAAAAQILKRFLENGEVEDMLQEVCDLDEEAYVAGRVSAKLYGYMRVPYVKQLMQNSKGGGGVAEEDDIDGIVDEMLDEIEGHPETTYFIGAGSTTWELKKALEIEGTLLGVDVVRDSRLLEKDADSKVLKRYIEEGPCKIIITPIGGQGFLFGRGNQQFAPEVIERVGKNGILVICTMSKMSNLGKQPFLVDTGRDAVNEMLYGYTRVTVGYGVQTMRKVAGTLEEETAQTTVPDRKDGACCR